MNECLKEYIVTGGVSQPSVLAPLLRNVMYNGVVALFVPEGTWIIAFVDDLAVVVTATRRCGSLHDRNSESGKILAKNGQADLS